MLRNLRRDAERAIARLEQRRGALEAELAGAGDDHRALARLGAEIAEVAAELAAAEERWLEVSAELEDR
jgi:ABC transport system ATP-binding/permease protein